MSDAAARLDYCPSCAAEVRTGDELCWLCKTRLTAVEPPADSSATAPIVPEPSRRDPSRRDPSRRKPRASPGHARTQAAMRARERLSSSKGFLYMALAVIALGVLLTEPGAVIGLAITVAPAIIAVEVASRRAAKSGSIRARPRVVLSFVLTAILANVLLTLAALTALGLACIGTAGAFGGNSSARFWGGEETFIAIAILGMIGAFFVIMRLSINLASKLIVGSDRKRIPGARSTRQRRPRQPEGLKLSTAIIIVAEITVAIGIGQSAPGLGVLMGFILVPGTLFLARRSRQDEARGVPLGQRTPVAAFLMGSLMGLGLMLLAAAVLLLYVCGGL